MIRQRFLVGRLQQASRAAFVRDADPNKRGGRENAEPAEPGMHREHHEQIHRHPRGIEEREQPGARRELAEPGQILQRLSARLHAAAR
nr:hypothetical protein BN889_03784 [uncultured bacterium]